MPSGMSHRRRYSKVTSTAPLRSHTPARTPTHPSGSRSSPCKEWVYRYTPDLAGRSDHRYCSDPSPQSQHTDFFDHILREVRFDRPLPVIRILLDVQFVAVEVGDLKRAFVESLDPTDVAITLTGVVRLVPAHRQFVCPYPHSIS